MNGRPHQNGDQQQQDLTAGLPVSTDTTASAAVTAVVTGQYNHSSIPPIRVQSDTPCPPSVSGTPSPGKSQVNGGPVVQLPALSSFGQAVTNGQNPVTGEYGTDGQGVQVKGESHSVCLYYFVCLH